MNRMDVFFEPLRALLVQIAAFLPRLVIAIAIIGAGWLLAKAVRFTVVRTLRAINVEVLTRRAGIDDFLREGGVRSGPVDWLGWLAQWMVIFAALVIAFNGLGLAHVSALTGQVLAFLPRVALALVVFAVGAYFARVGGAATTAYLHNAGAQDAELLGRLLRYAIVVFVALIAVDVLEVGGGIVRLTFLILLSGLVLALALAFGLGGQRWAAALLERWWSPAPPRDDGHE